MEDILDQTQIENNSIELKKKLTDIGALLENTCNLLFVLAHSKNVDISLNINEPVKAMVDDVKLGRVVQNLLNNAIKYSNPHSEVRLNLYKYNSDFVIEVIDNGQGIPADRLKEIFKPFIKFNQSADKSKTSYGLGLFITEQIVKLHHGSITVESEEGKGSKFVVTIPFNG